MKLNLGCGRDIRDDHLNVDIHPPPGTDPTHAAHQLTRDYRDQGYRPKAGGTLATVHDAAFARFDLNRPRWPFDDDAADVIHLHHVIEHLEDVVHTMDEAHRVLRADGTLHLTTPHYQSRNAYSDPTHKHQLTEETLLFFTPQRPDTFEPLTTRLWTGEQALHGGFGLMPPWAARLHHWFGIDLRPYYGYTEIEWTLTPLKD